MSQDTKSERLITWVSASSTYPEPTPPDKVLDDETIGHLKEFIQSCHDIAKNANILSMFETSLPAQHPGSNTRPPWYTEEGSHEEGNFIAAGYVDMKKALWDECNQDMSEKKQSVEEALHHQRELYERENTSHLQRAKELADALDIPDSIDAALAGEVWLAFSRGSQHMLRLSWPRGRLSTNAGMFASLPSEKVKELVLNAVEVAWGETGREEGWKVTRGQSQH